MSSASATSSLGAAVPAPSAFDQCLLPPRPGAVVSAALPLLTRCRNVTCLMEAHSASHGFFLPQKRPAPKRPQPLKALGELAPPEEIVEIDCNGAGPSASMAELAQDAFRWSLPLVLRGCAADMPAVRKWHRTKILLHDEEGKPGDATAIENVGERLVNDTHWDAPFGAFLQAFSSAAQTQIWVSSGGKRGDIHFDTFDNAHVVAVGKKTFRIVSPADSAHLYHDWSHLRGNGHWKDATRPGGPGACPETATFGCDNLGCFSYAPFNASAVDLRTYPRVGEAAVMEATLVAGDVLLLPSMWSHYVLHHPLGGGGSCVALTFTRQAAGPSEQKARPFAADMAARYRERVRKREADPSWRAWEEWRGATKGKEAFAAAAPAAAAAVAASPAAADEPKPAPMIIVKDGARGTTRASPRRHSRRRGRLKDEVR